MRLMFARKYLCSVRKIMQLLEGLPLSTVKVYHRRSEPIRQPLYLLLYQSVAKENKTILKTVSFYAVISITRNV